MSQFQYNESYFPPIPVVEVTLIMAAEMHRIGPLEAIVDSGADATIVPLEYLERIQAPATVEKSVRSQWGDRHRVMLYLVDVQVGGITLPGIEVVVDEWSDEVLLGRDVLNRLQVLMDGPRRRVEISE
jgi:hypothetical protein